MSSKHGAAQPVYGLMAEFDYPTDLVNAALAARHE